MAGIIHGESCTCCKDLSPIVKKTLIEVQTLMDGVQGLRGVVLSDKQRTIKELQEINTKLKPVGGISDIVSIAKKFFAIDFNRLDFSKLSVDKPNKKVGKFKVSDITDNPTIDPTKIMSFQGLDLSKLSNLKLSFTVPTIVVTKSLKFGPVSVGIKFFISLKEITWAPEVSADFPTPEAALAELKKGVTKELVRPSQGKSIKDLKNLAKKQFSAQPDILSLLLSPKTPEEFFAAVAVKQVNLYEEVNLGEKMEAIIKEKTESAKNIEKVLKDEVGNKLVESAEDLSKIVSCAPRRTRVPVFREDEILDVIPCAVEKEREKPLQAKTSQELKEVTDLLKQIPGPGESDKAVALVKEFVSKVDAANKIMQNCSDMRLKAVNRLYMYKEVELLHRYAHEYAKHRYESYGNYNSKFSVYFLERDRLQNERAEINVKIASIQRDIAQNPVAVNDPRPGLINNLIAQRSTISTRITAQEDNFSQVRNSFEQGLEAEINDISSDPTDSFSTRITKIRERLLADNNPVSNLVGFDEDGRLLLYANPFVFVNLLQLEANSKNPSAIYGNPGIISSAANSDLFVNYFRPLFYDFNPETDVPKRTGVLEIGVWKKYYSPNRIDLLFTWQEQGYTAPKPVFNEKGEALGVKKEVKIVNGQGQETVQEVPVSVEQCQVNLEVAVPFLETLEKRVSTKIDELAQNVQNGSVAASYLQRIRFFSALEAKYYYSEEFLNDVTFSDSVDIFKSNIPVVIQRSYNVSKKIYEGIQKLIKDTEVEIADYEKCIQTQEKAIEEAAKDYGKKSGLGEAAGGSSESLKDICKKKLGSDPVGGKPSEGECPNYTKNCYWEEYTKLLQIVSLMPIPDTEQLYKRLFRYYPVALQIPVPAPPGVLPSLATGIPDPQISIPLPFLWKHIVTLQTPIGLFVVWIALAGGFVPNPYIMLVDEKMQASFIVTPKGTPTPIPAKQLLVTDIEKKSLLEMIPGLDGTLRIDMSGGLGKLLAGSTRLDFDNPDSGKTVIDKLKKKIKGSLDDLEIPDLSFSVDSEEALEKRRKIREVLETDIPDLSVIDEVLDEVFKAAADSVDKINISSIKIPKNAKYMMTEMPSAINMLETFSELVDSALNAPAEAASKVLGDIGASIKLLNVNEKLNSLVRQEIDKPEIQEAFITINAEIDQLEAGIPDIPQDDIEALKQVITERTKTVKKAIITPLKKVAEKITPEVLGFVALAGTPLPLPVPCYSNVSLPAVPPYITAAIALIQQAPSLIEAFPDDVIADAIGGVLDLTVALPSAEQIFQGGINAVLGLIPPLILPAGMDENLLKMIKNSLQEYFKNLKIRLPKPGLPAPLVIPGSLIKSVIKQAITAFLTALKGVILQYVNKLANAAGPEKVAMVLAFVSVIKLLFGTNLDRISGKDIKSFIVQVVESVAYPPLDTVGTLISIATAVAAPFKSMMELFTLPDPVSLLRKEGPFFEIGTKELQSIVDPLLLSVVPAISQALPFPVILLAASVTPARTVLTKVHPTKSPDLEKLPMWEGLTLKNIPFTLWLDQLAATAQRGALLGSDYVVPYFTPLTP
jgi:dGTP triphosphohydrolase